MIPLARSAAVCLGLLVLFPVPVQATEGIAPFRKLGRGASNVLGGVFELPYAAQRVHDDHGILAACSWGILLGAEKTVVRMLTGVLEVGTFLFPIPTIGYDPILEPEFPPLGLRRGL